MERKEKRKERFSPQKLWINLKPQKLWKEGVEFHILVLVTLTQGGQRVAGKKIRLFLNGILNTSPKTDQNGEISYEFSVPIGTESAHIEAEVGGYHVGKTVLLPLPEKKEEGLRILGIHQDDGDNELIITLVPTKNNKGVQGVIYFTDHGQLQQIRTKKGVGVVKLPLDSKKRKVTFFLLENLEEKVEVEVPAKPRSVQETKAPEINEDFWSRMVAAYNCGRYGN